MRSNSDDLNSPDDERLDTVIAEYLEAVRAGATPDRNVLIHRHPDLAAELRQFFDDNDCFTPLATVIRQVESSASQIETPRDGDETRGFSPAQSRTAATLPARFGDYELIEELARGGMGVVYRARQISLNRMVALKMILSGRFASASDIERFGREAEAAAQLDHPNIVPIYDVGSFESQHFFSMKLVERGDLSRHLDDYVGNPRAAAEIVAQMAEAVQHAHQRGLLHRDLKPRNILLGKNGEPQVTDFGLAKRVEAESNLTMAGAIVGTAGYMAPEQARGERSITTAADIYSLGAILFELLTGKQPFTGATPAETIYKVLQSEPLRPRNINSQISRDLETICLKCLEKDPSRRYASASALADDLRSWLAGRVIAARAVGQFERCWRWCLRNPIAATSISLAIVVGTFFSIQLWLENRRAWQAVQDKEIALGDTRQAVEAKDSALKSARAANDLASDHLELS